MQDRTEPNRLPIWYEGGLSFQCSQCGHCCSGPSAGYVWVDESETLEIAKHVGLANRLEEFERRFTRRVGARVSLVEYSDGDCIFLDPDTRRCSVYESRPRQCRTWPFWKGNIESPKAWAKASKNCPGCNQGRLYTLAEIESHVAQDS